MSDAVRAAIHATNAWNAQYLEEQYQRYKGDPESVDEATRQFFRGFELGLEQPAASGASPQGSSDGALGIQNRVSELIDSYRRRGHQLAKIDPFGQEPGRPSELTLAFHGLDDSQLDTEVHTGSLPMSERATIRQIIECLERIYCGPIGIEFMHMSDDEERRWFAEKFEATGGMTSPEPGDREHLLEQLMRSEQFEKFLQKRYPGDKRFSLEGGESLIPLMDRMLECAVDHGVEEVVIGMSHRGRLNVLNNILGKSYEQIFTEFEDNWDEDFADGGGDVKYHRGYSGERTLRGGREMHLALASNPSHLESVNMVVQGRCRAKQRLRGDTARLRVAPVLIHGDAAVIGQGVVMEMLNAANLKGYTVGGTIHVVVNNQIGFTTAPDDGRSSRYCTDIGLMIETPVMHVNGMDPEAVAFAATLAMEYRQRFRKDVFIDLNCFRRYGHNEQDEPSFTQPILAGLVKKMGSVLDHYADRLKNEGLVPADRIAAIKDRIKDELDRAQAAAKAEPSDPTIDPGSKRWKGFTHEYRFERVETGVSRGVLEEVCRGISAAPEGFNVNPKVARLLKERGALLDSGQISYADAESLAYGTLLLEGHDVRLTGQDSRRGTFSHRHAVLKDFKTGEAYIPLNNMRPISSVFDEGESTAGEGGTTQGRLCIYDSPLSEFGVLGYEYGYSLADPRMMVLWEAQFGDFANGAQVMIDQYLASAELKWDRWSGLVLLLPHGYEGAGPEHSSCRIERFLQLAGNENMEVVHPSTGAQIFHLLRRHMKRNFRKPLVIATPKSMLRVPTSRVEELTSGSFEEVLDDPTHGEASSAAAVRSVLLCSGKIGHELMARRDADERRDVAVVRVEQLYPFHAERLREVLGRYANAERHAWVQEEPRNMGGYIFVADWTRQALGIDLGFVGRSTSASPAVGSKSRHKEEQEHILASAMGEAAEGARNSQLRTAPISAAG